MVAVLSSVDAPLAIDLLLLTNVDMPNHTATLEQVLACKETVLSAGTVVVAHKSACEQTIVSSASGTL